MHGSDFRYVNAAETRRSLSRRVAVSDAPCSGRAVDSRITQHSSLKFNTCKLLNNMNCDDKI
eukprot:2997956-Pleurochrysis_carterae.AAC.1